MFTKKMAAIIAALFLFFSIPILRVSSATSDATVVFTEGTGAVDPRDPDNPTEGGGGGGTGETGPLTLDYVSDIDYGSQTVNSVITVYQSTTLKPFIQVSDRRGNPDGIGWKVQASASSLSDGPQKLTGAFITLKNGEALSGIDGSRGLSPISSVKLNTDSSDTLVLTAPVGSGVGTWLERWYPTGVGATKNDSVLLTIPANPPLGNYHAEITWTLLNAV